MDIEDEGVNGPTTIPNTERAHRQTANITSRSIPSFLENQPAKQHYIKEQMVECKQQAEENSKGKSSQENIPEGEEQFELRPEAARRLDDDPNLQQCADWTLPWNVAQIPPLPLQDKQTLATLQRTLSVFQAITNAIYTQTMKSLNLVKMDSSASFEACAKSLRNMDSAINRQIDFYNTRLNNQRTVKQVREQVLNQKEQLSKFKQEARKELNQLRKIIQETKSNHQNQLKFLKTSLQTDKRKRKKIQRQFKEYLKARGVDSTKKAKKESVSMFYIKQEES